MKTLHDHTIIYDDECPMCREYTKAFVKTGMLDQQGRAAYTDVVKSNIPNINWDRARNEIAMINKKDNSVQYGIDSIMTIVGQQIPCFQTIIPLQAFLLFDESPVLFYFL